MIIRKWLKLRFFLDNLFSSLQFDLNLTNLFDFIFLSRNILFFRQNLFLFRIIGNVKILPFGDSLLRWVESQNFDFIFLSRQILFFRRNLFLFRILSNVQILSLGGSLLRWVKSQNFDFRWTLLFRGTEKQVFMFIKGRFIVEHIEFNHCALIVFAYLIPFVVSCSPNWFQFKTSHFYLAFNTLIHQVLSPTDHKKLFMNATCNLLIGFKDSCTLVLNLSLFIRF
jgi:hypothetical protein